jgi:regulator of cell morphogenesis and NO signaling
MEKAYSVDAGPTTHRREKGKADEPSLANVIDHVEREYHARLGTDLPRVEKLSRQAAESQGARHPELREIDRLFGMLKAALDDHATKEDRIVFPLIRWLDGPGSGRPRSKSLPELIRVMTHEHNTILATLVQIQRMTKAYTAPSDASADVQNLYRELKEFERLLHAHMRIEDTALFPRALNLVRRSSGRS